MLTTEVGSYAYPEFAPEMTAVLILTPTPFPQLQRPLCLSRPQEGRGPARALEREVPRGEERRHGSALELDEWQFDTENDDLTNP